MKVCMTVEVKIDQKLKQTPKATNYRSKMQITKEEKNNMIHLTKAFEILYEMPLV